MVLDLRAFDSDICNDSILIRGRLSRGVLRLVSESSPALVRVAPIGPSPRLMTSANSDGRLPFDCQLLDSRGEELRDVDQEYESLIPLTVQYLTISFQNTAQPPSERKSTSKSGISSWLSPIGKSGS